MFGLYSANFTYTTPYSPLFVMNFQMFEDPVWYSVWMWRINQSGNYGLIMYFIWVLMTQLYNVINFNGTFKLDVRKDVVVVDITG